VHDVIREVEVLSEKYRNNNKLSRVDALKVEESLGLLFMAPETFEVACYLMLKLPSDCACRALISSLQGGDTERQNKIDSIVKHKGFNSFSGRCRQLELLKLMIADSKRSAFFLLTHLAEQLTMAGRKKPGSRIVAMFRERMMDNLELLQIPLEKLSVSPRQISNISALVLLGLVDMHRQDPGSDGKKIKFLEWLAGSGSQPTLSDTFVCEVEKDTASWAEDIQRECVRLGLIRIVTFRTESETQTPKKETAKSEIAHVTDFDGVPKIEQGKGTTIWDRSSGPVRQLEAVAEYLISLEEYLASLKKELHSIQANLDSEKKQRLESQMLVARLKEDNRSLALQNKEMSTGLEAAEKTVLHLEREAENRSKAHREEIDLLLSQMDKETDYNMKEFKNMLAQSLRLQYMNFLEVEDTPMTADLGEHLRYSIRKVFKLLEARGISVEEG